jgi:NADH-quinone oxidoreductase subunit E
MEGNAINHPLHSREGKKVEFSPDVLAKVHSLIRRYPGGRQKSALLPVLHIAQEELGGHLTVDIMDYVAGLLDIQPIEVYEVATFYSMFYLEKTGKYVIEVCRTGPCTISGGDAVREQLRAILGIEPGETTPDGLFTLKEVECLGSCGTGPAMQVNTVFYEKLTPARVTKIIDDLRTGTGLDNDQDSSWADSYC